MRAERMKIFNQDRWNMLSNELKVSVACRYCALPYLNNLVIQTGLLPTEVHSALDRLTDMGELDESWGRTSTGWALIFRLKHPEFIDKIIKELT